MPDSESQMTINDSVEALAMRAMITEINRAIESSLNMEWDGHDDA